MSALYIGIMTGTSMDGLDAALVSFDEDSRATLVAAVSLDFPLDLREEYMQVRGHLPPQSLRIFESRAVAVPLCKRNPSRTPRCKRSSAAVPRRCCPAPAGGTEISSALSQPFKSPPELRGDVCSNRRHRRSRTNHPSRAPAVDSAMQQHRCPHTAALVESRHALCPFAQRSPSRA
jgi:hypothetical protein